MRDPEKATTLEARQAEGKTGAAAEHAHRVTCARVPSLRKRRHQPQLEDDSVHTNSSDATRRVIGDLSGSR